MFAQYTTKYTLYITFSTTHLIVLLYSLLTTLRGENYVFIVVLKFR